MSKKVDSKLSAEMYNEVRAEVARENKHFREEIIEAVRDQGREVVEKINSETAKFKDEVVGKLERIEQELAMTQG